MSYDWGTGTEQQTAKNSKFSVINTSFLKNLKINILSLIWTVENSALQRTVDSGQCDEVSAHKYRRTFVIIGMLSALSSITVNIVSLCLQRGGKNMIIKIFD